MKSYSFIIIAAFLLVFHSCFNEEDSIVNEKLLNDYEVIEEYEDDETIVYADIDFSNWKVTLPLAKNNNGGPDEYQPSQLMHFGYQTLEPVQPYINDYLSDSSLVFHTFPDICTTNSSYSRTELRELINPNNSRKNWTLLEGGELIGRLKVESVSKKTEPSEDYHKVIFMQIHGIISEEDMDIHSFSSNNGPPLIKMRWIDGNIYAYKKSLVDETTYGDHLLDVSNSTWIGASTHMGYVGFEEFEFRITASTGRLELQLNDETPLVYEDLSMTKWPFENYFKAVNCLSSTAEGVFSKVKYYELEVTHLNIT